MTVETGIAAATNVVGSKSKQHEGIGLSAVAEHANTPYAPDLSNLDVYQEIACNQLQPSCE